MLRREESHPYRVGMSTVLLRSCVGTPRESTHGGSLHLNPCTPPYMPTEAHLLLLGAITIVTTTTTTTAAAATTTATTTTTTTTIAITTVVAAGSFGQKPYFTSEIAKPAEVRPSRKRLEEERVVLVRDWGVLEEKGRRGSRRPRDVVVAMEAEEGAVPSVGVALVRTAA